MTGDIISGKLKTINNWRELAALLFIPADVMWLAGWFCLLIGLSDGQELFRVFIVFALSSTLAYLLLRILYSWTISGILRVILGGVAVMLGLWLGESLLISHYLVIDLRKISQDIWSGFEGLHSLSGEFWALTGICVVWLRSIFYARKPVIQDVIVGRLQFDLGMMLILLFFPSRPDLIAILIGLTIFLLLTLSSLSFTHIADINFHRGGKRVPFQPGWLMVLFGISIGFVIISGSLAMIVSRWISLMVIALTNSFIIVLRFILEKLFGPILLAVLTLIQKLWDLFYTPGTNFSVPKLNLEPPEVIQGLDIHQIEQSSAESLKAAQPYILVILLAVILVGVILLLLKKPWQELLKDVDDYSGEKIDRSIWKRLQSSLGQRIQTVLDSVAEKLNVRRAAGLIRAARIRWVYRQLELYAARMGVPRPVAVTPIEYKSMLTNILPNGKCDLDQLTSAYLSVRYGELPETADEVALVLDAWGRLRKLKPDRNVRLTSRLRKR